MDKTLNDALEDAIAANWHRTKAEFIRDLVRRKLEEMGYHPPKMKMRVR